MRRVFKCRQLARNYYQLVHNLHESAFYRIFELCKSQFVVHDFRKFVKRRIRPAVVANGGSYPKSLDLRPPGKDRPVKMGGSGRPDPEIPDLKKIMRARNPVL